MIALAIGGLALILLTWVVYPLVMAGLARGRRAPQGPLGDPAPTCTVVLATRERAEAIQTRVANLLDTEYPPDRLEIVVALDTEPRADVAAQLARLDPRVRVVYAPMPGGKACALSGGVAAATGEALVFADTFQRFDRTTIPRLVGALEVPGVGAASGRLVLPAVARPTLLHRYWDLEVRLREHEAARHSSVGVFGPVYAMRRDRWTPLPARLILDDLYGPMQVVLGGARVTFVREAVAYDLREPDPVREYWRKARTLAGNIQLWRWLPAVLLPIRNPIWACFVFHKVMRFLTPVGLVAIAVGATALAIRYLAPAAWGLAAASLALVLLTAGRRLSRHVAWGAHMIAAIVAGLYYGVRGQWDVWRR